MDLMGIPIMTLLGILKDQTSNDKSLMAVSQLKLVNSFCS